MDIPYAYSLRTSMHRPAYVHTRTYSLINIHIHRGGFNGGGTGVRSPQKGISTRRERRTLGRKEILKVRF